MQDMDMDELSSKWLELKSLETRAKNERSAIEEYMLGRARIDYTVEGTKTIPSDIYENKITCKLTKKIDSDLLQEIAAENGLSEHLSDLFRWKPELNIKAWKAASEEITGPLSKAITSKPARPGFKIVRKP
jgi:hypothetical protein